MSIQTKGLNRDTTDKFYTSINTVNICIELFQKNIQPCVDDLIIEPSAGNGSFIESIKKISNNYLFYDIKPEHSEIIKQDYLNFDYTHLKSTNNKIHIIGNPPFGRQSSLAIKFIKQSCNFCDSISFILPKSFKKDSMKRAFPLNFHLIQELDLPDMSFIVDGKPHDVPCVFQIWEKKNINRTIGEKMTPHGFNFVKKEENPDISFRRVGVNAGTLDTNINEKSIQSHYFIKFTNNKTIQQNLDILSSITYDFNNTVGPKSISKQELIYHFNSLLTNA